MMRDLQGQNLNSYQRSQLDNAQADRDSFARIIADAVVNEVAVSEWAIEQYRNAVVTVQELEVRVQ